MERARKVLQHGSILAAALSLSLVGSSAYATELCHNIGGPEELGANCDGATGTCTVLLADGGTLTVGANQFLGIVVGEPLLLPSPTNTRARDAHIAHGDGLIDQLFSPPLHLASTGQNHRAANVECLGTRINFQPPEPGN